MHESFSILTILFFLHAVIAGPLQPRQTQGDPATVSGWVIVPTPNASYSTPPITPTAFIPYTGASYTAGENTTIYAYYVFTRTLDLDTTTTTATYNATNILVIGPSAISQGIYYDDASSASVEAALLCSVGPDNVGVCEADNISGTRTYQPITFTTMGTSIGFPATYTQIPIPSGETDPLDIATIMQPTATLAAASPGLSSSATPIGPVIYSTTTSFQP